MIVNKWQRPLTFQISGQKQPPPPVDVEEEPGTEVTTIVDEITSVIVDEITKPDDFDPSDGTEETIDETTDETEK